MADARDPGEVLERLRALAERQAFRSELWNPIEASLHVQALQEALRELHEVIEGQTSEERGLEVLESLIPHPGRRSLR